MPSSSEILASLSAIADDLVVVAIGWHLVLLLVALAALLELRPKPRMVTLGLTAPVLGVALVAFAYGNPFNGTVFALLALALAGSSTAPTAPAPAWARALGVAAIVFGAVYPHFTTGPWFASFVTAPIGLLPCPTLAVVGGFALLASTSRVTTGILAVAATGYAVVGVARLGVVLDLGLAIVALGLVARSSRLGAARLVPA